MRLKLRIWRQKNAGAEGKFVDYNLDGVSEDSSFLEMLDLLNGQLIAVSYTHLDVYKRQLDNRSFGGAQVARTFYARGQTGQQLLLGAYQALARQIAAGTVKMFNRTEMLDLIVVDGRARGIVVRDMCTGEITPRLADVVVVGTGGYSNAFFLSTNAKGCNLSLIHI